MSNIIEFKKQEPTVIPLDLEPGDFESHLNTTMDLVEDLLQWLDQYVCEVLQAIPGDALNGLRFQVVAERFVDENLEDLFLDGSCLVLYSAQARENGKRYEYFLYIHAETSPEEEDEEESDPLSGIRLGLCSVQRMDETNLADRMNLETGCWETNQRFQKMMRTACGDTEEAVYLTAFGDLINTDVALLDENEMIPMLQRDRKLIKLKAKISRLTRFYFIICPDRQVKALLIPDDPLRYGGAVMVEQDSYVLCQFLDEEDLDGLDPEGRVLARAQKTGDFKRKDFWGDCYCLKEVARTRKERELRQALWLQWDHYSGDSDVLCMPLSFQYYAESRKPTRRFTIRCRYGRTILERLNEQEKQRVQQILDLFGGQLRQ